MQELISHLNNELQLTSSPAIAIETLSSLQILHLILQTLAYSGKNRQFLFSAISNGIPFLTGAFELVQDSTYNSLILPIWILCFCYLALFLLIAVVIALFRAKKEKFGKNFLRGFALICLIHSRVLFFPIQFFLLSLTQISDSDQEPTVFYKQTGVVVTTALLIVINAIIALGKEFILYQLTQNKNYYAVKTNRYHQITIIYKCLGLILYHMSTSYSVITKVNGVLHLIFACIMLYVLYVKLPFYKFRILKLAIISTALNLALSVDGIIQVFATDAQILEGLQIFLLFAPGAIIKFCLGRFKILFQSVLKGNPKSPEHSIHMVLLIKELLLNHKKMTIFNDDFLPNMTYYTGVLQLNNINISELSEKKGAIELQLYSYLAKKLEDTRLLYPDSKLLLISASQIYLKKLDMPSKAMELIKKMESKSSSIPVKSSIRSFYSKLDKAISRTYLASETQIELQNYFKYNRLTNSVKDDMLEEINKHLYFWQDLHKSGIDVKKTVDNTQRIDFLWNKITRLFLNNFNDLRTHFQRSILMYSVYLNNVRQMPEEGSKVLKQYNMASLNESNKDTLGIASGVSSVVIVSIDKQKLGEILDVSGSIHSVFGVNKKDLIGQNFACLFPIAIARKYKYILQQITKNSLHNFDHKDDKTYGKLPNGDLFELEAHLQLYPHMNREVAVMILLKKLSGPKLLLIANRDGQIIDCSKSLEAKFLKESINMQNIKTLQDMTFEFKDINLAFNRAYSNIRQRNSTLQSPKNFISSNKETFLNSTGKRLSLSPIANTVNLPTTLLHSTQGHINSLEQTLHDSRLLQQKFSTSIGNTDPKGSLKEKSSSEVSVQDAKEVCERFKRGQKLTINHLLSSPLRKQAKLRLGVQISPHIIEEDVYKIIHVTDFVREKVPMYFVSKCSEDAPEDDNSSLSSLFADEFPPIDEKHNQVSENQNFGELDTKPRTAIKKDSVLYNDDEEVKIINMDTSNPGKVVSYTQESQHKPAELVKRVKDDDQRNSIMDSNHKEARISKALRLISSRKKIHPLLKWSIVIVYIVILAVACLAWLNFDLSRSSIHEIDRGIDVVNVATLRMQDILRIWQYSLIMHENTVGVQYYPDYLIGVLRGILIDECQKATSHNNDLKNQLALVEDPNFIQMTFEKNIQIWNSPGENYQQLDTFVANDVLVSKYLAVRPVLGSAQTTYLDDISLLFNNTANDYMVTSLGLIDNTEGLLQHIINRNISNLKVVFTLEILSVATLFGAFLILLFVILHSYKKLFRAVTRTQEKNILMRLSDLSKIKSLFEEDIETQAFHENAFNILENDKPKVNTTKAAKNSFGKSQPFIMAQLNVYVLRCIILALVSIPIFTILFAVTFSNSLSTFKSFENEKQKVSVLSELSYQEDLFLNSLLYTVIYQNDTDILFFNQNPKDQLVQNLDLFKNVNEKLTTIFLAQDGDTTDPIIESILKDTVCPFLSETTQADCQNATKGGQLGLTAINTHILQSSIDLTESYIQNSTLDNAKYLLVNYNLDITTALTTVKAVFPFLTNYVLAKFDQKVEDALQTETVFFVCICGVIIVYALFVHLVCLTRLRMIDLGIRKILKIIPYQMIQENRAMSFYLIRNFGKEIEGVKNIL